MAEQRSGKLPSSGSSRHMLCNTPRWWLVGIEAAGALWVVVTTSIVSLLSYQQQADLWSVILLYWLL